MPVAEWTCHGCAAHCNMYMGPWVHTVLLRVASSMFFGFLLPGQRILLARAARSRRQGVGSQTELWHWGKEPPRLVPRFIWHVATDGRAMDNIRAQAVGRSLSLASLPGNCACDHRQAQQGTVHILPKPIAVRHCFIRVVQG